MKVLYLSEWYPSEKDKMVGLFVQKHAESVIAQGAQVQVNTFWTKADVVQLNILTLKKGLMAYLLKRLFGIPYILVEHWSGYLPENGQFCRFPKWKQVLLKFLAREASGIYPVSHKLENSMKTCGITNKEWGRIDNVVDDFFYDHPITNHQSSIVNILHVSCFDERAKNVKGLLRAIKQVSAIRQDFILTLVGTGPDWQICRDYAQELAIPAAVLRWTGELTPMQVCHEMQQTAFFVLPSSYENAPVVISECIAMGIPVVSTTAGGIPEMVNEKIGILVKPNDDEELVGALIQMLDQYQNYDKEKICEQGKKFSYEKVGKCLMKIYEELTR